MRFNDAEPRDDGRLVIGATSSDEATGLEVVVQLERLCRPSLWGPESESIFGVGEVTWTVSNATYILLEGRLDVVVAVDEDGLLGGIVAVGSQDDRGEVDLLAVHNVLAERVEGGPADAR